jgi:hypothetical protein
MGKKKHIKKAKKVSKSVKKSKKSYFNKRITKIPKKKIDMDLDDLEVIPDLEDSLPVTIITDSTGGEDGDEDINKEVIVDNAGPADTLSDIDGGSETFSLHNAGDDPEESELQTIRANPKPRDGWSDRKKAKFTAGDLVILKVTPKNEEKNVEPYKIVCPSKDFETYSVRKSRMQSETILKGKDLKKAPKDGKPYLTYWEAQSPFNVPGVRITIPSNSKK